MSRFLVYYEKSSSKVWCFIPFNTSKLSFSKELLKLLPGIWMWCLSSNQFLTLPKEIFLVQEDVFFQELFFENFAIDEAFVL